MLDQELKNQLKEVFSVLSQKIELVYLKTGHSDQDELMSLLGSVAECSPQIIVRQANSNDLSDQLKSDELESPMPSFFFKRDGQRTGVTFKGIPNGHEFTSLILAILNADGKGKMPDALLARRIKSIKGPVRIRTFMSLTCETCPDVVQALNQMAFLHSDFQHDVIDGGYIQDEIKRLNIQGVPSVMVGDQLLHSGRITFLDLISKLEAHFGISEASGDQNQSMDLGQFDVVVVGGGPAGASAAIYSVRKGLRTALIAEKIGGQVQETKGIENLISVPYTEGPQLAGQLSQHLAQYPVQIFEHRKVKKIPKDATGTGLRRIELESGEHLDTSAIIVSTGAKWRELGIPGEKEYLGRGVAFCPHCDGPFYKGKKVAVIGGGNSGVEAAIDLAGIVKEVVLFEFLDVLKADKVLVDKLMSMKNVSVVTSAKTSQILGDGQKVLGLEYIDRKTEKPVKVDLDGVFVQIGLVPNSQFLKDVVELTKFGEVVVDGKNRTSAAGIYAAGDVTTIPYKQIIISMGDGAKAALAAFEDRMKSTAH